MLWLGTEVGDLQSMPKILQEIREFKDYGVGQRIQVKTLHQEKSQPPKIAACGLVYLTLEPSLKNDIFFDNFHGHFLAILKF